MKERKKKERKKEKRKEKKKKDKRTKVNLLVSIWAYKKTRQLTKTIQY